MPALNTNNIKSYINKAIKKLEKSNKLNKNIIWFWGKRYTESELIKAICNEKNKNN